MNYTHEIKITDESQILEIYRCFDDGTKELLTSVSLPDIDSKDKYEEFEKFAKMLGENVLFDSPRARKWFSL